MQLDKMHSQSSTDILLVFFKHRFINSLVWKDCARNYQTHPPHTYVLTCMYIHKYIRTHTNMYISVYLLTYIHTYVPTTHNENHLELYVLFLNLDNSVCKSNIISGTTDTCKCETDYAKADLTTKEKQCT